MIILRDYQQQMKNDIYARWQVPMSDASQKRNVLGVAPTGSGKTALMSSIFRDMGASPSIAIAHRQELVYQISMALAGNDVPHRIIAPTKVIQLIVSRHVKLFGKNYHHDSCPVAVAAVKTLINRKEKLVQWANHVQMWTQDEAHHVLPTNQWGTAAKMFPNAVGLGLTASPIRCDNKPLGAEFGGMFHDMVLGPTPRFLIDQGHLCDYKIYAPPSSINLDAVKVSSTTGDYNEHSLRKEAHKSTITGDIVEHYLKLAAGKRGITFTVDVKQAEEISQRFNKAGVPSDAVSAMTPDNIRQNSIDRFERGDIKQLVNVDLFGEGFDVPAVEIVSMGRPTQSFGLYIQQFGRALRPADGKSHGIILDHVGNVKRHGLPDAQIDWSFKPPETRGNKKNEIGTIPIRTCLSCFGAYEAVTRTCPWCGEIDQPESRGAPEFVDGDLTELTPDILAQMRGDVDNILERGPAIPVGASPAVVGRLEKLWNIRQETVHLLRERINMWAAIEIEVKGRSENQSYPTFWHKFGVDAVTCQTMKTSEMVQLMELIQKDIES